MALKQILTCPRCGRQATCKCAFVGNLCRLCAEGAEVPLDIKMELFKPSMNNMLMPKLLHFVWVGTAPFPERDAGWVLSWLRLHPEWQGVLWAEHPELLGVNVLPLQRTAPQRSGFDGSGVPPASGMAPEPDGFKPLEVRPLPPLVNRRAFDEMETQVSGRAATAARSDLVRMEIVARYGGVYLDTDVECWRNTDELWQGVKLFFADEWGPNYGSNYMFGGVANHPALWSLVRDCTWHFWNGDHKGNVLKATGPDFVAPKLRTHPDCVIFPGVFFMPLCAFHDPEKVEVWPEASYGNHRCDGKWYDREKTMPPPEFLKNAF